MFLLCLSLLAIFVGVLCFPLAKGKASLLSAIDGFVLVSVGGLVFGHLLPHGIEDGGLWGIAAAGLGLALPWIFERFGPAHTHGHDPHHQHTHHLSPLLIGAVILGVAFHAMLDGAALSMPGGEHAHHAHHAHGSILAWAVLLHRIPVGFVVSSIFSASDEQSSIKKPLCCALLIAVSTVIGYFFGVHVLEHLSESWQGIFEAFVAGALLHVVFGHEAALPTKQSRFAGLSSGLGAFLGLLPLIFLNFEALHEIFHGENGLSAFLSSIFQHRSAELFDFAANPPAFHPETHYALYLCSLILQSVAPGILFALIVSAVLRPSLGFFDRKFFAGLAPTACDHESGGSPFFKQARESLGLEAFVLSLLLLGPFWTISRFLLVTLTAGILQFANPHRDATALSHSHEETPRFFKHFLQQSEHCIALFVLGLLICFVCLSLFKPEFTFTACAPNDFHCGISTLENARVPWHVATVPQSAWALVLLALVALPARIDPIIATLLAFACWALGFGPGGVLALCIIGPWPSLRETPARTAIVFALGLGAALTVNALPFFNSTSWDVTNENGLMGLLGFIPPYFSLAGSLYVLHHMHHSATLEGIMGFWDVISAVSSGLIVLFALWSIGHGGLRPWLAKLHLTGRQTECPMVGHGHHETHEGPNCAP